MYEIYSSSFGYMTCNDNLEKAISSARHYKKNKPESTITIWTAGTKIITIEN